MSRLDATLLVFFLAASASAAAPRPAAVPLALRPCEVEGVAARCGTYEVFEDRTARRGRKIGLRVVVVPAESATPLPDPLVLFAGGPGSGATTFITDIETAFAGIHRERDILMVDVRGTGASHALRCPDQVDEPSLAQVQRALDAYHHTADVVACREALSAQADLRFYTTAFAVDDVDDVRRALGYERVNLWGFSYGSRAALVYLRRHGEAVRSVFVAGVVPTDMRGPLPFAAATQAAFDALVDTCAADAECAAAFPDPRGDLQKVLERLRRGPVTARFAGPDGPRQLSLGYDAVVRTLRSQLYSPVRSFRLPALLHRMAAGDFDVLGPLAYGHGEFEINGLAGGFYLSIYCSEDVPFIDPAEVEAATAGTFYGDGRIRAQIEACRLWPRGIVPDDFLQPVRSDVPVLLVSGAWDPASAPRHAERAARYLTNRRHIVLPFAGHGPAGIVGGMECFDRLSNELVLRGTVEDLDTSCVEKLRRPPFTLDLD